MGLLAWLAASRLGRGVAAAAALLVALGALLLNARRNGEREAARRALGRDLDNRRVRDAVDRDVARDPDAAGRLRDRWSRD